MRVGLLIYGTNDTISGGYLYNRKLVDHLESRGDRVEIFSLPGGTWFGRLAGNFDTSLRKRLLAADLDILVQDELAHPSLFLANHRLRHLASFPIVTLVHLLTSFDRHPFYKQWFIRYIETRYLKSVTGMILNSRTTRNQAQRLANTLPPACIAVPAGDNFDTLPTGPDALLRRANAPGPLKILVVGNVIRRKGLHVLLRAIQQLPAGNFRVTVAGRLDMEPDYVSGIKNTIRTTNLQDCIKLKGPVEGHALADMYQRHHVMALPSAFEGYGIVYVEAQQFGLPVIGTTAGAAREIITDGDNGFLIAPGDSAALAGHLKTLHDNRQQLLAMSRHALAAYDRHPRWRDSCETIRQFLLAQLGEGPDTP